MHRNLDELAFEFFKLYAQYESSLKERGFFIFERGKIIVNWDGFVNEEIGRNFLTDLGEERVAAEYILNYPPKKQTVNEINRDCNQFCVTTLNIVIQSTVKFNHKMI